MEPHQHLLLRVLFHKCVSAENSFSIPVNKQKKPTDTGDDLKMIFKKKCTRHITSKHVLTVHEEGTVLPDCTKHNSGFYKVICSVLSLCKIQAELQLPYPPNYTASTLQRRWDQFTPIQLNCNVKLLFSG